ncbi:RNA-splicing factor [Serendipita sp. 396]|nr:RNA-splicing factor [Serendipita sp. 396]KAG9058336.1 RNA-splicing factor [Serendipita sp. 407]
MYNGIGLTTPRGSGTNGYVMRNISYLRSHDSAADRAAMEAPPMKHREPDKEILEHERKRKIEVACYELRVQLEDEEYVHIVSFVMFFRHASASEGAIVAHMSI